MLQYLFDTDHLTLYDHSDVIVWRHFSARPFKHKYGTLRTIPALKT
jgi:hypothetical protein